jgi:DNA-binding MarR family transcriptional regulator
MPDEPDVVDVAEALGMSLGLLRWRLRQTPVGELSLSERSAMTRLDRGGPATAAALARREGISPQGMGLTLGALEERGLIERRADPEDGRRVLVSLSEQGRQSLRDKRNVRTQQIAKALSSGFTDAELTTLRVAAPLIERLAEGM